MKYILIPLIVIFAVMALVSLVRGIVAFLHGTRLDLERDPALGPSANQLRQSQMMVSRIKYQALAIVVAVILMALASH